MFAFYLLVVICAFAIWFLSMFAYKALGGFVGKLNKDFKDIINEEEE